MPPPLQRVQDWPVEAGCLISYPGTVEQGDFLKVGGEVAGHTAACPEDAATVAEVEEFFARVCFECDRLLGEPASCRWFLNWADDTPRDEMRTLLLAEVRFALTGREAAGGGL